MTADIAFYISLRLLPVRLCVESGSKLKNPKVVIEITESRFNLSLLGKPTSTVRFFYKILTGL